LLDGGQNFLVFPPASTSVLVEGDPTRDQILPPEELEDGLKRDSARVVGGEDVA